MKKTGLTLALAAALGLGMTACNRTESPAPGGSAEQPAAPSAQDNPFFVQSDLPLRYPHFDRIRDEHFAPAFEAGMAEHLKEVAAIAGNTEAPSFDNTLVALENSGQVLDRATTVFFNLVGTDTNDARKKLQAEFSPRFAAHRDAIMLDPALFGRIQALYDQRATLGLDAEGVRLVERYHDDFVRAGARLSDADKVRLKEMNAQLATLGTQFDQNVLNEVNASAVTFDSAEALAGSTDAQIAAAAAEAKKRGLDGKYVVTLLNTTGQPPLTYLGNRDARQKIFEASAGRGSRGNEFDNTGIVSQVIKLRAERAAMLGFPNHAAYSLADATAKTPEAVNAMLGKLAPAAIANARREAADLQAMIDKEQAAKGEPTFKLEPWDWAYYAEKVRQERYNFDEGQLKPYFEMKNVLENGVFFAATQLYGITFKERKDIPVYNSDMHVYEVFDKDGSSLALFYTDYFKRDSKSGGAWMDVFVEQDGLTGAKPVVYNVCNFTKPAAGQPALLSYDDVTTMFHEFGHALHGMFSKVKYPSIAGTSTSRDFVEFPSQFNEHWASDPKVFANYAKHYKTGEPMPQALVDKIKKAGKFNSGYATTEYLSAALLDLAWHTLPADAPLQDVDQFEAQALKKFKVDLAEVPPRYRTSYFDHIWGGGYSAGYYAYFWSEVLDHDAYEWFKEHGGMTAENGQVFRDKILSRGNTVDLATLYRDFRGKDPSVEPLLENRGLK